VELPYILIYSPVVHISGCQVAVATEFFTVAPNVVGSTVWNLLYVTRLATGILR
jgi:hypothetical protein